ncbi:uncharacterized protein HD556DRAFT_1440328 [Suillus plorans]|uniref:LysM domain-containing protein n=1 Tax=Suillus plorans TaxID=116603 RepID=A0A9P7DMM6_9AGAM|nr:uncharacterized protein HD556DRAFT_1440328 [Suillus plorans]KAG1798629.1 hypothetical protein HD556DRAFT_1440328 [Suillus plorans]
MHASFFAARLVVLAAISLVVSAQSLLPDGCDRNVTVHAGDTCDKISAAHNVSTYQLAEVNSKTIDRGCDNLGIGEVICLGIKGHDCKVTHVVKGGETCHSIADAVGIPEKTLLTNNPNVGSDCSSIYPGEVLCTSKKIYVKAT